MAVYEGVLHKISGGPTRPGRWTRREFIDIGEQRIKYLELSSYHDELLQDSLGQEIALSVIGSGRREKVKRVIAMRTKRGVDRCSRRVLVGAFIGNCFAYLFLSVFVGLVVFFALAGILRLVVGESTLGAVIWIGGTLAVIVFILSMPLVILVRQWRAWSALDERPWQDRGVMAGS
jgi:hypothetical protein